MAHKSGLPHIAESACKDGVEYLDVYLVLDAPLFTGSMAVVVDMAAGSGVVLGQHERPYVDVVAGRGLSDNEWVVFVDRFERVAFHSEPGHWRFEWLFQDWM